MEFKPTTSPADVFRLFKEGGVKIVDLRFIDFPGVWQHFSVPVDKIDEDAFENGLGFDGSSIRGWQGIQESDMLVFPDATFAFLAPFARAATDALLRNIH